MPPITDQLRTIIWVVVVFFTLLFSVVTVILDSNIRYFFRLIIPGLNRGGKKPSNKPMSVWILFYASAIIASSGTAIASVAPKFEELYNVQIEGMGENILVGYSQTGFLWRRELDSRISKLIIDDVDNDGDREIIVGLAEPGPRPGWLIIYDESGMVLDESDIWEASIYPGIASETVNIIDVQTSSLLSNKQKQIIVISNDTYWYASKLSILDFSNDGLVRKATYWNPGLLYSLTVYDLDSDGIKELLITGVNNDLQSYLGINGNLSIALMLEGDNIFGQAPPWFGDSTQGSQVWYLYALPKNINLSIVSTQDIDGDEVNEILLGLSDGCSFYLDTLGRILALGIGTSCKSNSSINFLSNEIENQP